MTVSPERREEILAALRRGTVPQRGLDALAVGLEGLAPTFDEELQRVRRGSAGMKAVRGEYGSGKSFLARFLGERAKKMGLAAAEVQVSEAETPLHRLETVYRRLVERLATADTAAGALRTVVDGWFFALEQDVLAEGRIAETDTEALLARTGELMEKRLLAISRTAPAFTAVLRAYRAAVAAGDPGLAEGLLAWLGGQPNVAAAVKRAAGVKGDLDHFGALSFLQGLLVVLRDSGYGGLLLVLDEVETLQRVRGDVREKGLNALRQLIDEIDAGRFPGLYLVVTGTPAFFDGPQGIQRLPALAQRLHVDFGGEVRFDNPRAPQVRLRGFDLPGLSEVGRKVRDIFAEGSTAAERVRRLADDAYVARLAAAVTGKLGGRVGVAPRLFLKKLVADVIDRIEQFPDFDPSRDYALTIADTEATAPERGAMAGQSVDDIELP